MKWIFAAALVLLIAAGAATTLTEPDLRSDVPVLYWVTDRNPARLEQVDLFHQWLIDEGHTTAEGIPKLELRLDIATRDPTNSKKIIQSVAGVAGDLMDCDIGQMHTLGVLRDVTGDATELNFGLDQTYPALGPMLTRDGRQYGFPCNIDINSIWSNVKTFEKLGMDPPPRNWSVEQFEAIGREFVKRANTPGQRQTAFFMNTLGDWQGRWMFIAMIRSRGVSLFNETMTASTADDPRVAAMLGKFYQWTYIDHLMPTGAEVSSLSSAAGYGGPALSHFEMGNYGMIIAGRWALIQMRRFQDPPTVQVSYFPVPEGGFTNDLISARFAAVYKGSDHPELAVLFLSFLASDPYNQQIVENADALPPGPAFAETEAYKNPQDYPNEWGIHKPMSDTARDRAIAKAMSPFISEGLVVRYMTQAIEKTLAEPPLATPEEAARVMAEAIDHEIGLTIRESTRLKVKYDQLVETQKKIDAYRAEGRPVPLEWITNPFHRRYYLHMGWAVDESGGVFNE